DSFKTDNVCYPSKPCWLPRWDSTWPRYVKTAVKDLGPFDGILGFSQGAALVAMLCALQEQKLEPAFNFHFAILVAGFHSCCSQHRCFYEGPAITVPSLHVFGQDDRVIPEEMTQILIHPGGHFVPAASSHRQTYQDFLKKFHAESV
uniref:Esterase OVCA2 n=1 Tax=Cyprinus carpio TaxID=7962 RepID=A0A8C1JGF6_CYPCA